MFLKLLLRNFQMLYRTLKSVALRPLTVFKYKISSLLNISKFLNTIPKFFTGLLARLKVKPEKREDYVDAGRVFIAKSLIVILVLLLIAIPLLIYYVAWPWIVSMYLTAKFYVGQPQLVKYNGKVEIYYEKKLENLMFKGRLKDGKYTDVGEEYYDNAQLKYSGNYLAGKYDGNGTLYTEDGKELYKGNFKTGVYDGNGELLLPDGSAYKGDFVGGKRTGKGRISQAGKLLYEGDMKDDQKEGKGKQYYPDGSLAYEGAFAKDVFEGDGTEYYQRGKVIKYQGAFKGGLYSGKGVMYDEKGNKIYEGGFEKGLFSGAGRYYGKDGQLVYDGSFVNGLFDGSGKLYKNGAVFYDGSFLAGMLSGTGTLTDVSSGLNYTGLFENNDIAYGQLFNMKVEDIYKAFTNGLSQDTSKTDYFYLYNQAYGLVLKLAYATDKDPAKLVEVFALPNMGGLTKLQGIGDLKLPGVYEVGKTGESSIDGDVALLLGLTPGDMKYYKANYAGYGVCYWTNPDSGDVAMIEFYPLAKGTQQGKAGAAAGASGGASRGGAPGAETGAPANGEDPQQVVVYFNELGLDMKDFASLGY